MPPDIAGRASPPTERVVAILDFLAQHPHDRFGLSELTRGLALSEPTCLGILSSLTAGARESMGGVNPAAREELRRLSTADSTAALPARGRRRRSGWPVLRVRSEGGLDIRVVGRRRSNTLPQQLLDGARPGVAGGLVAADQDQQACNGIDGLRRSVDRSRRQ